MTKTLLHAGALSCALLASTALTVPAHSQTAPQPSVFQHVDSNGVDLVDGSFNFSLTEGSIGAGESALAIVRSYGRGGSADGLPGRLRRTLSLTNNRISLAFGSRAEHFDGDGNGSWVAQKRDGATLTGSGSSYTYTAADGTVIEYGAPGREGVLTYSSGAGTHYCVDDTSGECDLMPLAVRRPNGRRLELHWRVNATCGAPQFPEGQPCSWFPRLAAISNESAYLGKYLYADNASHSGGPPPDWFRRTGVQLVNTALAPCDPQANSCATAHATIGYPDATQIIDPGGETWRIVDGAGTFTITRPGSIAPDVTVTRNGGVVASVTADGVTTQYSLNSTTNTMTVTNARSEVTTIVSDPSLGRPTSVKVAVDRTTSFAYDSHGRLTRVTAPLGNYVEYVYDEDTDVRGNVTHTVRSTGTNPAAAAPIVTRATYAPTCVNVVTCNLPISTTDAANRVTDYRYDQTHGGILSVTAPAVEVNGQTVRPQVRTTYAPTGVRLPTRVSACQTLAGETDLAPAACIGTADEVRTTIRYDANNQPDLVTTGAGNGDPAQTTTQELAYDARGNVIRSDGPLAGTEDTAHHFYDQARRPVGTISPDPDGPGHPLPRRAQRITYRQDGQPSLVESGTATGTSLADLQAMIVAEATETRFAGVRPVATRFIAGGAIRSLTEVAYDPLGRIECTAVRMDETLFATERNACLQSGPGGIPDRITKTFRNEAGDVTEVRTEVDTAGLPDGSLESAATYTRNGRLHTLRDGENNLTTFRYDGHDRLRRTEFPVATGPRPASNPGDFEELGYDELGNVTFRQFRGGQGAIYTYDALGRMTHKNLGNAVMYELDSSFGYDLLGRMTSASDSLGQTIAFGHDALGRRTSEASNWYGTTQSAFDPAGRRTGLTWRNGFFVTYEYLVTGEMQRVRENGVLPLAVFHYDGLGRRTRLERGNGTATHYQYGADLRLSQIRHDLAGLDTASDVTTTFGYNAAGQIASSTRDNDLYALAWPAPGITVETPDGLNRLDKLNGAQLAHDPRGNLTSIGGASFGYTVEGRMNVAGGQLLYHDPLGRLAWVAASGTNLVQSGSDIVEEFDTSYATRFRWVPGPGVDEPLIEYQGAGTANPRWLHADERGSIVAVSDVSGNAAAINRYDEYGAPASGNVGRIGYTGRFRLGEIGLYYNRARMYHPGIGRFLQPDPIGYGDGMNMYAYVGGDPVNRIDPTGLSECVFENAGSEFIDVCGGRPERPEPYPSFSGTTIGAGGCPEFSSGPLLCAVGEAGGGAESSTVPPDGQPIVVTGPRRSKRRSSCPDPEAVQAYCYGPRGLEAWRGPSRPRVPRVDWCGGGGSTWPPEGMGRVDWSSACRRHDTCYASATNRAVCDRRLASDIMRECTLQAGGWPLGQRELCYGAGGIFYIAVRRGGRDFYVGTGNPE